MVAPVTLRDAATVMLVRDGGQGLEVFMLRRNLRSDFVGGAYVFPGGAVDDADRHADLERWCRGRTDADASEQLDVARGGLAYWVAAIRECFEEAGILLACDSRGRTVRLAGSEVSTDTSARFEKHRADLNAGTRRLVEICAEEDLQLAVDGLFYFGHWITPVGAPRRYDTRFFVGAAPEDQTPLHDDREVIANLWIRPAEALRRAEEGDFTLILPTMRNLEALAGFDRVSDLLAAAATAGRVPTIQPRVAADGRGVRILIPGDPGYAEAGGGRLPPDWSLPPARPSREGPVPSAPRTAEPPEAL
ncbi:MAG: NUDIX hydrolase [Acidimicrobiales bacterium]